MYTKSTFRKPNVTIVGCRRQASVTLEVETAIFIFSIFFKDKRVQLKRGKVGQISRTPFLPFLLQHTKIFSGCRIQPVYTKSTVRNVTLQ